MEKIITFDGLKKFKTHASSAGEICAGSIGCTEKQLQLINENKLKLGAGKKLTDNQEKEHNRLLAKQANPELPKGAKTYCQQWLKEQAQMYGIKKKFETKYTIKGNTVEWRAMELISEYLGVKVVQNEERFENEWCLGIPDARALRVGATQPIIIDNKSSWDPFSFPLFKNDVTDVNYKFQAQVYMDLTDLEEAKFIYTLIDTPKNLVEREARNWCWENGVELTPEIVEEFRARMSYDHLPMALRVKEFHFYRDDLMIGKIHERVEKCRTYIDELVENIKSGKPVEDLSAIPDEA